VLSRKLHTHMAVLRRSETGRVAVDLLHGDFWGLILGSLGKARISVRYDTQISEHATASQERR
jgi:hypothetical protein